MIAYDRIGLDAQRIRQVVRDWHSKGLVSDEKWQAIQEAYKPGFYSPNVFVRIGLGIFTYILLIASMGMGWMVASMPSTIGSAMLFFLFGGLTFVALERWAIGTARHFGSGVDDMMLYFGTGLLVGSIYVLLPSDSDTLVYAFVALPFLVFGSIRYIDRLMTLSAFGCLLLILFLIVKDIPRFALYALPFSGMLYAAAMYLNAVRLQANDTYRHWHQVLNVVEMLSLLTFYVCGNFWVVHQAGVEMFQLEQMPIPWFFWAFTFLVPVAYIVWGMRRKDRILLDMGLACVAAAVFTFRYYFHVISLSWAATIAGALLFATAYFAIRYLRKHSVVFTYEADGDTSVIQEIEEQLIEQTIARQNAPGAPEKEGPSFGGGSFGGGGAGADF